VASDDARLRELLDKLEISEVLTRYARGIDRRDWDLVRSCYHEDAIDDHGMYSGDVEGFIAWVAERHSGIEQSMHFLGNTVIELDGDVAFAETYLTTYAHETRPGSPTQYAHSGCRYVDRLERRDQGPWKLAERHVVFEFSHVQDETTGRERYAVREFAERSRDDLVYRIRGG
jgi:ketosteroid isomerase-like protein